MRFHLLVLIAALLAVTHRASAEPAPAPEATQVSSSGYRLVWHWRRPGIYEYVGSGLVGLGALSLQAFTTQPPEPKWVTPVWFDSSVRNSLRHSSAGTREKSSLVSDFTGLGAQIWAYSDATLIPLFTDAGNFDVAWQMTVINLQASALNILATRGIDRLAVRQRPDIEPCREDPEYHEMCFQGANSSFPSGHTSFAFLGAGLVCAHHLNVPLYAHPYADAAACAVASTAAVATGVLRLVADRHYATDVLAGATIGATTGFLMPMFAHYWFVESDDPAAAVSAYTWLPIVGASSFELAFAGRL